MSYKTLKRIIRTKEKFDYQMSQELIRRVEEAYNIIKAKRKPRQILRMINYLQKTVRGLNKLLKNININTKESNGEIIRITSTLGRLRGKLVAFKELQVSGAGIRTKNLTNRIRWEDLQSVFNGRMRTSAVINLTHKDLSTFLNDVRRMFIIRMKNMLKKERAFKVNVVLSCKYNIRKNDQLIVEDKFFNTKNEIILESTDLRQWYDEYIKEKLITKTAEFQERDSGWSLQEIVNLEIHINKYDPLRGGSSFIEVPNWIQKKHAVVNVQNKDDPYCFLWSIMAAKCNVIPKSDQVHILLSAQ